MCSRKASEYTPPVERVENAAMHLAGIVARAHAKGWFDPPREVHPHRRRLGQLRGRGVGRGPHRWCLVASRQGRFVTAPSSWQADRYPLTTRCGFCQQTLTIDLADGGPSTITVGHAADCVQSPDRARQGSAA